MSVETVTFYVVRCNRCSTLTEPEEATDAAVERAVASGFRVLTLDRSDDHHLCATCDEIVRGGGG